MIDYGEIRRRVPMPEAAARYGVEARRGGHALCPFHTERTPSMKIYPDGFYCFGCGTGGDVVDFAARLFSLSPHEAAKKLDADFALGLTATPYNAAADLRRRCSHRREQSDADWYADRMRKLLEIRQYCWHHRFDGTGETAAAVEHLDYIIDNFTIKDKKEVEYAIRRFSRFADGGVGAFHGNDVHDPGDHRSAGAPGLV